MAELDDGTDATRELIDAIIALKEELGELRRVLTEDDNGRKD